MHLTIIGANGGVGRELVTQALGHGHDVMAFIRDSSTFDIIDERLGIVVGDVLDPGSLDPAIAGSRAVLFTVGSKRGREPTRVYSDGIHNVIDSMRRHGVDRLVCVSAAGVGAPNDPNLPFLYKRLFMSVILREIYADMERMEHEVMLSDLTWTIVRPAGLVNGPLTGAYRVAEGRSLPLGQRIGRADVAAFMLKCLSTSLWDNKGVAIAE